MWLTYFVIWKCVFLEHKVLVCCLNVMLRLVVVYGAHVCQSSCVRCVKCALVCQSSRVWCVKCALVCHHNNYCHRAGSLLHVLVHALYSYHRAAAAYSYLLVLVLDCNYFVLVQQSCNSVLVPTCTHSYSYLHSLYSYLLVLVFTRTYFVLVPQSYSSVLAPTASRLSTSTVARHPVSPTSYSTVNPQ